MVFLRPLFGRWGLELMSQGYVTLRPEDDEDMWHVYNLISEVSRKIAPCEQNCGRSTAGWDS
jgi:hypothetical protein